MLSILTWVLRVNLVKLLRLGIAGQEVPAALDKSGKFRNLSSHIKDLNSETINFKTLKKLQKLI